MQKLLHNSYTKKIWQKTIVKQKEIEGADNSKSNGSNTVRVRVSLCPPYCYEC